MQRRLQLENKDDQSFISIQFSKKGEDISKAHIALLNVLPTAYCIHSRHNKNKVVFFQQIIGWNLA